MSKALKIGTALATPQRPLIAVPMLVADEAMFQAQINQFNQCQADIIEWRIDAWHIFFDLIKIMPKLLAQFNKPVLVTYRTQAEGGQAVFDQQLYHQLNLLAVTNGASAIDIEVDHLDMMTDICALAEQKQVTVIGSKHCFDLEQPAVHTILAEMVQLPVDVVKFAESVQTSAEAQTLLMVTQSVAAKTEKPLITIAMGVAGQRSRMEGYQFGSQLTFGSLTETSAPGQLQLFELLNLLGPSAN
ncbi:type I 3-dehydroquinate dehydratase [Weissella viridescens]|uniref:3-dehydroquinate dehydratase n=1 Tax=Weissella viridescens TaxID=1629 RepID=A0A3P2RDP0_WEIVI|nr:type I 3-dehydroquinate dehydratase [Weissella viridescens]RRG17876.1 type I 3-dehydroquinate dehydratase [Weissella viridescens]